MKLKIILFTQNLLILITLGAFYSCLQEKQNEEKKVSKKRTYYEIPLVDPYPVPEVERKEVKEQQIDTAKVNFGEVTLLFPNLTLYTSEQNGDSVILHPEIGSTLNSQKVIVKKPRNVNVQLVEQYKTSASIPMEGPHLDLVEWKGFESAWVELEKLNDSLFVCSLITEEMASQFPEITQEELAEEVLKMSNERVAELILKPYGGDWKKAYWVGLGLRKIKVLITDELGNTTEKLLIFYIPMGC